MNHFLSLSIEIVYSGTFHSTKKIKVDLYNRLE